MQTKVPTIRTTAIIALACQELRHRRNIKGTENSTHIAIMAGILFARPKKAAPKINAKRPLKARQPTIAPAAMMTFSRDSIGFGTCRFISIIGPNVK
jgi:hypothetical protein